MHFIQFLPLSTVFVIFSYFLCFLRLFRIIFCFFTSFFVYVYLYLYIFVYFVCFLLISTVSYVFYCFRLFSSIPTRSHLLPYISVSLHHFSKAQNRKRFRLVWLFFTEWTGDVILQMANNNTQETHSSGL